MKTTSAGIFAAVAIIFGEVSDLLDDKESTVFQADLVMSQLFMAWGLFQAANKKPGDA